MSSPFGLPITPQGANTGRRKSIYQTPGSMPMTSSATSDSGFYGQTNLSTGSRKRERSADGRSLYETPSRHGRSSVDRSSPLTKRTSVSHNVLDDFESQIGTSLPNTCTNTTGFTQQISGSSGIQFRKPWIAENNNAANERDCTQNQIDLLMGANEQSHMENTNNTGSTWGGYVFKMVGGVAGKMWEFCRTSAFRGFTAGGGTSYEITENAPKMIAESEQLITTRESQDDEQRILGESISAWRVSRADESETISDYRPAKRFHGSSGWVIVDHNYPVLNIERAISPSPSHKSFLPRPVHTPISTHQPRRSTARLPSRSHEARSQPSASYVAARSSNYNTPRAPESPVSVDVQRFAAKRQREDYQTDASIWRLNQQLTAMIRQGQEALANKVDVGDLESKETHDF